MTALGDNIYICTLANGIRMVCRREPGACVEYFGVAINAGSRDERPGLYGLAHFVEHTIFKGTNSRSSRSIINRMESVGGELNAYTTKEETLVYSVFPKGNMSRAAELILDLVSDSVFPETELDKEREVVVDEINSYLDIPSESIYDCFEEEIFAGSQLAHNILGDADTVRVLSGSDCRRWLEERYRTSAMVLFYSGDNPDRAVTTAMRHFGQLSSGEAPADRVAPADVEPFAITRDIGSHQSHNIIGARIPGMYDSGRHAMALLNNILGGPGMNSRLNVELRERRGLVYSVDSSLTHYTDAGIFSIYYGCDPEDSKLCRRLVLRQLRRMADELMGSVAFGRALRQFTGQMMVASSMSESRILSLARGTMYHGVPLTTAQVSERIMSLTPDDLLLAARRIVPGLCSILTFE